MSGPGGTYWRGRVRTRVLCLRAALALLATCLAAHPDDELTEAARRDRVGRLRSSAVAWYTSRKSLVSTCTRCKGAGKITDIVFVHAQGFRRLITCPGCEGRGRVVFAHHYRKLYFDLMSPRYRLEQGCKDRVEQEYKAANRGSPWPRSLDSWSIDRVELADATHGVVWAKLDGEKAPVPMRWIWTDESDGKPEWFVYSEATDGPWPGGWKEAAGAPGGDAAGPEEIDWMEWSRRADEARRKDTTTLNKVEALKAEAARVVIAETVKIVDIEPANDGARIIVCALWGGPGRGQIDVSKDDLPLVKDWGKWDRIRWKLRLVVGGAEDNDIRSEVIWNGPGSVEWSKNAGLGGYQVDLAEPASFADWRARFDAADASGRKEMLAQVKGKTLVDEATVVERVGAQAKVRFGDGETATFPLEDPQAQEEVRAGDTLVVARWPDNLGTAEAYASRENLRFRYGVLERKPGPD